jgi:hypothetical protein
MSIRVRLGETAIFVVGLLFWGLFLYCLMRSQP